MMLFKKKYLIYFLYAVTLCCAGTFLYAQEKQDASGKQGAPVKRSAPDEQQQQLQKIGASLQELKHSVEVLRKEIKNVRSSVTVLSETVKQRKGIAQAVAELNLKLESQAQTVQSLSGELYRLSSNQENGANKKLTEQKGLDQIYKEVDAQRMLLKDLKSEIRILREVQADLQAQAVVPSASRSENSFWGKVVQWKFWGHAACGIALIALVIAL